MNRIVSLAVCLLASPLLAEELPSAKPAEVGLDSEKLEKIDPAVKKLIDDGKVAGAVVLVGKGGKVTHFEAYGVRDIDTKKPMERDTVVRIYSMTKPITSVAAMALWEQGKFKLDDPVHKYLPEFKDVEVFTSGTATDMKTEAAERPMTVRDLLRHTSGLTYGFFGDTPIDKTYRAKFIAFGGRDLKGMSEKLGEIPLLYQPGTKFVYSLSTDVLARLVEVASGENFDVYLQKTIFDPLGMKDTGFYVKEESHKRFASVHGAGEDKLRVTEPATKNKFLAKPKWFSGGGGLCSTARDYARFCQMLLNKGELDGERILKAETVGIMTRDHLPKGANVMGRRGVGFGLGFSVQVSSGRTGEYGWGGAASTHFWISPKDDLFVVALQQFQPYNGVLEDAVKPIVYGALKE